MKRNKNVGIITLNGYFNFGNRLQNYALTKTLENMGFNVYTLWDKKQKRYITDFIKTKLFFIKKYRRFNKFYKFSKKNMDELLRTEKNYNKIDYFVVGSDQVWNYKLMDKDYTWFEAPKNKITFSYSASFGTSILPDDFACKFKNQIINYNYISVREKKAKELIDNLNICKKVEILIDPTLLLSLSEWNSLIKNVKMNLPKKYVLLYFLGDLKKETYKKIKEFSYENDLSIINIMDLNSKYYDIGPLEFLYLIKNSKYVFTDSFHACVFSFKFDKSFVIFKRNGNGISNDMYSRIENFISTFKIENREYNGKNITKNNLDHDYAKSYKLLESERKKSDAFLRKAFDIKG